MLSNGFKINECNQCVYVKDISNSYVIVCLYVDGMQIMKSNHDVIMSTKRLLLKYFDMKDMSKTHVILRVKIIKTSYKFILTQSHYFDKILKKFNTYESMKVFWSKHRLT